MQLECSFLGPGQARAASPLCLHVRPALPCSASHLHPVQPRVHVVHLQLKPRRLLRRLHAHVERDDVRVDGLWSRLQWVLPNVRIMQHLLELLLLR